MAIEYLARKTQVREGCADDHIVISKEYTNEPYKNNRATGQSVECNVWEGVRVILKKSAEFSGWDYEELSYGNMNVPGAINDTDAEEKVKALAQKYAK